MSNQSVRIKGLRELNHAFRRMDAEILAGMRPTLRKAAEPVRALAQDLFSSYDAHSAAGYRVRVRMRGVAVEQSLRRTTGEHPSFGRLQMSRALIPALQRKQDEVVKQIERLVDRAADHAGF